jgi:S-adenosylmethionine decarboxylase
MIKNECLSFNGFNNLAKSLDLNLYTVKRTVNDKERGDFITYIDERFNSSSLRELMGEICRDIDATILGVSTYDYDPHGASALILLAEEEINLHQKTAAHLDKSHISLHTYPEHHHSIGISTFRLDITMSTCGNISPLKVMDKIFGFFEPHIAIMDYRVRGYTRDIHGKKVFVDTKVDSLQECFSKDVLDNYTAEDFNRPELRSYTTRLIHKDMMSYKEEENLWNEIEEIYLEQPFGGAGIV